MFEQGCAFRADGAAEARELRPLFAAYLRAHAAPGSDLEGAQLVFGELVANVARHAPGALETRLTWCGRRALLEVADGGTGFAFDVRLPPDHAENHRGLFLVHAFADAVVIDSGPRGTTVRALLPVSRR